ncbi:MAG: hypothetical protein ABIK62_07360, partial [candidate division WOR-3 bacterium]
MILLLVFLNSYAYDYHDWLNLPTMDRVVSITTDEYSCFVAVTRGIYQIDRVGRKLVRTITAADGIRGGVRAIGFDPIDRYLWILSDEGLLAINPFNNVAFPHALPDPDVNSLGLGNDYIYLARDNRYFRLGKRTGVFDTIAPRGERVTWYGAKRAEKPTDYPFLTPFVFYDQYLEPHPITVVFRDGRRLWVGTRGYGVLLYSMTTRMPMAHWRFGPISPQVRTILEADGAIWFIGDQDIARYSPIRDSWSVYPTPFNAFYFDGSVMLQSKVLELNRRENIMALLRDSSGAWLGTRNGLYYFDL